MLDTFISAWRSKSQILKSGFYFLLEKYVGKYT